MLTVAATIGAFAPAATAGPLEDRLKETKAKQKTVRREIAHTEKKERVLTSTIATFGARIRKLDEPIGELSARIEALNQEIAEGKQRIQDLQAQARQQKQQIKVLGQQLDLARQQLVDRAVEVYKSGQPTYAEHLLKAGNVNELVDRSDIVEQVTALDQQVVFGVERLATRIKIKRAQNGILQRRAADQVAETTAKEQEVEQARAELVAKQDEIESVKAQREEYLSEVRHHHEELEGDLNELEEASNTLAEAIRTGNTAAVMQQAGPSPAGFIWPVSGAVVSGFGPRWGRMHEGIDIAAGSGTPILAVAAGVVTYSGGMSGYGNLVVVQHGGSLSTAYAHMSVISAGNGQVVTQGQVIGYVGCTGHCYGDHLHFETRINGGAVDPLGYL